MPRHTNEFVSKRVSQEGEELLRLVGRLLCRALAVRTAGISERLHGLWGCGIHCRHESCEHSFPFVACGTLRYFLDRVHRVSEAANKMQDMLSA